MRMSSQALYREPLVDNLENKKKVKVPVIQTMVACGSIALLCYEIAGRNLNWGEENFQKVERIRCYKMLQNNFIILGKSTLVNMVIVTK